MTEYLILIYGDEQRWEDRTPAQRAAVDEGHARFRREARMVASGKLEPTGTATTLRSAPDGGRPAITDGPFLETKEVLGGFHVIEAADLDQALRLAGGLAELHEGHGGIQVHPLEG